MIHQIIQRLYNSGELKALVQAGWVSSSILLYYELSLKVQFYKQRGMKTSEAVIRVSMVANVSESTVYRAMKELGSQFPDETLITENKTVSQAS